MYVATRTRHYRGKVYSSSQIVEGYRTPDGKVRQRTIVDISKLGPERIAAVKAVLQGKTIVDWETTTGLMSLDYGLVYVVKEMLAKCGLPEVLGAEGRRHWPTIAAMIANRLDNPCAKYSLRHWAATTAADDLLGAGPSAFHHKACYLALDYLEKEQKSIEDALFARRGEVPRLFFYDITSTYFEGTRAELAAYGYSRDKRSDRLQVTIGLATDKNGLPISVEVFAGNTRDASTVKDKVDEFAARFGARGACFVGDRGMRTAANTQSIKDFGLDFILALNHREVLTLVEKDGPIKMSLFDERDVAEVTVDGRRLVVCKNPVAGADTKRRRDELIDLTGKGLERIRQGVDAGRLIRPEAIQRRCGQLFLKHRTEKFFRLDIDVGTFGFERDKEVIQAAERLDGVYVVETTLSADEMSAKEIQSSYKTLQILERAFRITKDELSIRPIYHWRERRIRGHVFLCFLAYLVEQTLRLGLRTLTEKDRPEWAEVPAALRGWHRVSIPDQPHLKAKFTGFTPQIATWLSVWQIPQPG